MGHRPPLRQSVRTPCVPEEERFPEDPWRIWRSTYVTYYSHCVNHRMVEVGRTSGSSTLVLGQGHLELVAQDHITE